MPITYAICNEVGYEKRSAFAGYMLFAVTYICGLGMISKPFDAWSLIGLNALTQHVPGYSVNFMLYTVYMLIVCVVFIVTFLLIGKFVLKIDTEPLKNRKAEATKLDLNYEQKLAIVLMAAFLVIMYASSMLPKDWVLTVALNRLGLIGVSAIFLVIIGVWRHNGQKVADVAELAKIGVPWSIVFLMVGNCVVASGIKSADAGIVKWLATVLGPMVSDLSPILFYVALIVLYGVATQLVHNVVLLSIFNPIALTLGDLVGANPVLTCFIGIVMLSVALATAGASSRSGLVFGNTEWIDPKHAYLLGVSSVVIVMIAYAAIGIPLALIMFPM